MLKDELVRALKEKGFDVLYYKSKTSNSHYIKLDFGAGKSIRISDHKGKAKYRFRYNLRLDLTGEEHTRDGSYQQSFYGPDAVNNLVSDIMVDRKCNLMAGDYDDRKKAGRHKRRVAQENDDKIEFMRLAEEI